MLEKMAGQLALAAKIRAVNLEDVASLVIDKHFLRDIKGNLRKFTTQEFRCVNCNAKYRRPPLQGNCTSCGGKLLFTVAEGTIRKYLDAALQLVAMPNMPIYLQQTLEILKHRIESIFGKEATKQIELKTWFQ
jgi:DNA polymerase II large subunit